MPTAYGILYGDLKPVPARRHRESYHVHRERVGPPDVGRGMVLPFLLEELEAGRVRYLDGHPVAQAPRGPSPVGSISIIGICTNALTSVRPCSARYERTARRMRSAPGCPGPAPRVPPMPPGPPGPSSELQSYRHTTQLRGRGRPRPEYAPLPPQRKAEEVGRAQNAHVLVGVVQAKAKPPFPCPYMRPPPKARPWRFSSSLRRSPASADRGRWRRYSCSCPEREAKVGAADAVGHPLPAEREAGVLLFGWLKSPSTVKRLLSPAITSYARPTRNVVGRGKSLVLSGLLRQGRGLILPRDRRRGHLPRSPVP